MLTAVPVIGGEDFTTEPRPGSPKREAKQGGTSANNVAYFRPEAVL